MRTILSAAADVQPDPGRDDHSWRSHRDARPGAAVRLGAGYRPRASAGDGGPRPAGRGTAEHRRDFDRHFRPTSNRVRERWEQLALAERRGAAIPPIEVYRIGGLHFVSDGHHRVSIAVATGQQTIDAYVTEIFTAKPPNFATRTLPA
jgi:hypothetical protein